MAVTVGRIQAILELKNRMSAQLREAMKDTDAFQSKMDKLGQQATRLGGAMTAGITAPLGLIAAQSVKTFATFEKEMAGVAAVTGATGEDFGKLEALSKKMGETTIFTASQSAEAMRSFGLAGFETDEIMSALGPTLNLAAAGSMSMGEAADIAAKVTKGYGIEAEGTAAAMDVLTKAFTTANTDLGELSQAFRMVGPVAKTVGMSFENTTASLQIMANAGLTSGMAGRQLRRALLSLVKPSSEAQKQLDKLGVVTNTAEGRMRPFNQIVSELEPHLANTAAMTEIFGTISMPAMVEIIGAGSDALKRMTKELEKAGGTGQRIADVMVDNVAGSFTLMQSAVEGVWLAIGKQANPVMRVLLKVGTKVAQFISGQLVPGFAKLSPALKAIIVAIAAVAAAAGPLILAFGLLAPTIPAITTALAALAGAFSFPVVAIGALVAIVGTWIAKSEQARNFAMSLGKFLLGLGKVFMKVGGMLVSFWIEGLHGLMDGFSFLIKLIPGVEKAIKGLTKFFGSAGDAMLDWGKETEEAAETADDVAPIVDEMNMSMEDLAGTLDDDLNPATEETVANWEKIAKTWREGAIPEALDMVKALKDLGSVTKLTDTEQKALNDTLHAAMEKYDALGEAVPQDIMDAWMATLDMDALTITGPALMIGKALDPPKWSDLPSHVTDGWIEIGGQLVKMAESGAMDNVPTGGVIGKALAPPAAFPEHMYTFGKRVGTKLKDGFAEVVAAIPQTILDAFTGGGGITGAMKGIGSMFGSMMGSSIGSELGKNIAKSSGKMGKAFGEMLGPLLGAVGALAGPLIGAIVKMFKGQTTQERIAEAVGKTWGHAISDGLAETIAETADEIGSDWGGMMMHLADIFKDAGGVMAFGLVHAIDKTRDLFSAVEMGTLTVEQAQVSFGSAFRAIADEVVASGEVASQEFLELLELQREFGFESADVLDFIEEQSTRVFGGLAAMMVPLQTETDTLTTRFEENAAAMEQAGDDSERLAVLQDELLAIQQDQQLASAANKTELEAFGLIAVGAFGSAVEAGLSFVEAARLAQPAISSLNSSFEALGLTSDNVAFNHLARWNELILKNDDLVDAVDAFDDVLLGLSVTGGLTTDTLRAMGDLGVDQFDRLIAAGFSENEALLMMAPNIFALVDAYKAMGIPIDENTQQLLDMAIAAGQTNPSDQVSGWQLVTDAIGRVVGKLDDLINAIRNVPAEIDRIPGHVEIDVEYRRRWTGEPPGERNGGWEHGEGHDFQHGGVGNFGSGTLAMLHGHEAIIPLEGGAVPVDISGDDDSEMLSELKALREEMELLPVHLRDAMITSQ